MLIKCERCGHVYSNAENYTCPSCNHDQCKDVSNDNK